MVWLEYLDPVVSFPCQFLDFPFTVNKSTFDLRWFDWVFVTVDDRDSIEIPDSVSLQLPYHFTVISIFYSSSYRVIY